MNRHSLPGGLSVCNGSQVRIRSRSGLTFTVAEVRMTDMRPSMSHLYVKK